MSKYVFSNSHEKFDIENALTITKGIWEDGNPNGKNRLGYFVTSGNDKNEVSIANKDNYICGVTIQNDEFLGLDVNDKKYCVVQSLGICKVRFSGTLVVGDKCMPNDEGKAIKSSNNLGYRVVGIDGEFVEIIMSPNNDMVQRIKEDVDDVNTRTSGVSNSRVEVTNGTEKIRLSLTSTSPVNAGLYDGKESKWIFFKDTSTGLLHINGETYCPQSISIAGSKGIFVTDTTNYPLVYSKNGNIWMGATSTSAMGGEGGAFSGTFNIYAPNDIKWYKSGSNSQTLMGSKGGTFTGAITVSKADARVICSDTTSKRDVALIAYTNGNLGLFSPSANMWILTCDAGNNSYFGVNGTTTVLYGSSVRLGSTSGTVVTSDRNLKKNIEDVNRDEFFDKLRPRTYKYELGTSDRTHTGFITQEVEEALESSGMTTQDFGGVVITKNIENFNDDGDSSFDYLLDKGIHEEHDLIYQEFIALNTDQIQKLKKRVSCLEEENENLKSRLALIEERLNTLEVR